MIVGPDGIQHRGCTALLQALGNRVSGLEDLVQLLERPLFRLGEEEVHEDELEEIPKHEEDVEVVADVLECWARSVSGGSVSKCVSTFKASGKMSHTG